ncbi:hypothetical protein ACFWPQ_16250 [Streptomyces sp. NPDC058464]|uniref:hypothetical protein n=1 Tax=Streptomyces sp. NPDC058464 TaxID=3346511 RepID=UPI00365182B7
MTSSDRVSARFVELLDTRPETLREAAEDFGHLVSAPPLGALGVLRPRSAKEVGYARAKGAIAYPVNALPMSPADRREHHGSRWSTLAEARGVHDPHGILGRGNGLREPS